MNITMILKLVYKDWLLLRWFMLGYVLLGLVAAGLMVVPSSTVFYAGVVSLITVLIGSSAHVVFGAIVIERKEYQLSFIMGLPIGPLDYALSKLLGGLAIYLTAWLPILIATIAIVMATSLPDGLIPMILICALEILAATTILLSVSILISGEAATIIVMVLLNLFFNLFLSGVAQLPGINPYIEASTAVFNSTVMSVIGIEFLIIAVVLTLTIYIKSRRRCFL